tara:strand:+ start:129 stop:263 length:135 start_codon:yes stop_codon:yes gene_type:complete
MMPSAKYAIAIIIGMKEIYAGNPKSSSILYESHSENEKSTTMKI